MTEHSASRKATAWQKTRPKSPSSNHSSLITLRSRRRTCVTSTLKRALDCSPFGCRTGFHLLTWGTHPTEEVAKALKESLEFIAYKATWDDVPATTEKSCGNYRDHSLFTAKEWAKQILEEGISSDPFERKVV